MTKDEGVEGERGEREAAEPIESVKIVPDSSYATLRTAEGSPDSPVLHILWQTGPIQEVGVNGVQPEDVLKIVLARLRRLRRAENERALRALADAIAELEGRRKERMHDP